MAELEGAALKQALAGNKVGAGIGAGGEIEGGEAARQALTATGAGAAGSAAKTAASGAIFSGKAWDLGLASAHGGRSFWAPSAPWPSTPNGRNAGIPTTSPKRTRESRKHWISVPAFGGALSYRGEYPGEPFDLGNGVLTRETKK